MFPEGAVAVVTGGSRGIGRAASKDLVRHGVHVVVNLARSEDAARQVVDEICRDGGSAEAVRADVTNEVDVREMFREARGERHPRSARRGRDECRRDAPRSSSCRHCSPGGWFWDYPYHGLAEAGVATLALNEPVCAVDPRVAGSIERMRQDVLSCCDAAGVEEIVVCANSLGGLVAIDPAVENEDRVAAVVSSGAPGLTPDPDIGLSMDRRKSMVLEGAQFEERMLAALFHRGRHLSDQQFQDNSSTEWGGSDPKETRILGNSFLTNVVADIAGDHTLLTQDIAFNEFDGVRLDRVPDGARP